MCLITYKIKYVQLFREFNIGKKIKYERDDKKYKKLKKAF